jgi:hypothetical protein
MKCSTNFMPLKSMFIPRYGGAMHHVYPTALLFGVIV